MLRRLAPIYRDVLFTPGKGSHPIGGRRRHGKERKIVPVAPPCRNLGIHSSEAVVVGVPCRIQIATRADPIASISHCEWVAGLVVAHEAHERSQRRHLTLSPGPGEHERSHILSEVVGGRLFGKLGLHEAVAPHILDLCEKRLVVAWPRALAPQGSSNIGPHCVARHRLRDPERARGGPLAGAEEIVVDNHPLVVHRPAVVANLQFCPFCACEGEAVGNHGAPPSENALGLDILPQGPIVILDGRRENNQPIVEDVEVVAAVETSGVGAENHAAHPGGRKGHIYILDHADHGPVLVPSSVRRPDVGVVRCALN
mmetsp:Transcript_113594/g.242501  ORF Transcript_113594/g.242501 Transcript_113594/m.242501 type:complete len:313 (+) Transcript_113594:457-1395(+)